MDKQIKVRGIALMDGRLLCVRLKPYPGSTQAERDIWCLPGGGVDNSEPLLEALRREIIEELGVEPKIGRLLYVQQFARKGTDYLEFFFQIENAADYVNVDLSNTTHGAQEIEQIDYIDPKTSVLLPEFLQAEPLAEFAASNQPPKFFANY